MVAYAGATWDWHRLRYDTVLRHRQAGCRRPVVDGQVLGAMLAQQLQDRFGPLVVRQSLHFRFKNLVFAGETVRCTSRVVRWPSWPQPRGDRRRGRLDRRGGRAGPAGRCRPGGRHGAGAPMSTGVALVGAAECDLGRTGRRCSSCRRRRSPGRWPTPA